MRLSHSVGAFILPLLQHVCKKKTDWIWVFEKNQQLGLLGSKWFNRIYYLHVLHSAHKQEAVAATFSTENLFLKKFTHDSAAWKEFNTRKRQHEKNAAQKRNMKIVQHGKRATWKKRNIKQVQHLISAAWKECNMEIARHGETREKRSMKRMQHEESLHKKAQHGKSEHECSTEIKKVDRENSSNWGFGEGLSPCPPVQKDWIEFCFYMQCFCSVNLGLPLIEHIFSLAVDQFQSVIFKPRKVPWNWITLYSLFFVSPGLMRGRFKN